MANPNIKIFMKEWHRKNKNTKKYLEKNEKIRLSKIGKTHTEETKNKLRIINLGKKHTQKHIFNLKENAKTNPNYGMKGKHFSERTKIKMRKSRLEGIKERRIKIWNKGLTKETDERVKLIRKTPMKEIIKKIVKTRNERNNYFHTEESKKKMSATRQGITLEKWKKFSHYEPYDNSFNIKFKQTIRKRDNQICMNCGIHREKLKEALTIHHINYNKKLSISENCISLCRSCHTFTNLNRGYWIRFFQAKLSILYGYQYSTNGEIIFKFKEISIPNFIRNV